MNTQTQHRAQKGFRRKRLVSAGLLLVFLFEVLLPSALVFTPVPVNAQEESADGGLLGGLLKNPMLMMMLMMMLMQLFRQGGQGTPQAGNVDEQPPAPANVSRPRPRPLPAATPAPTTAPTTTATPAPTTAVSANPNTGSLENKALYLVQNLMYPETLGLKKDERVTVYNAEADARTVEVRYPAGSGKQPVRIEIPTAKSHVLKFSTEGIYTACTGRGTLTAASQCPTTVTVSP